METKTQLQKIRDHLKLHGKITTMESFSQYKITRLSEYIRILRHEEHLPIDDEWINPEKGNRYKVYKLEVRNEENPCLCTRMDSWYNQIHNDTMCDFCEKIIKYRG